MNQENQEISYMIESVRNLGTLQHHIKQLQDRQAKILTAKTPARAGKYACEYAELKGTVARLIVAVHTLPYCWLNDIESRINQKYCQMAYAVDQNSLDLLDEYIEDLYNLLNDHEKKIKKSE